MKKILVVCLLLAACTQAPTLVPTNFIKNQLTEKTTEVVSFDTPTPRIDVKKIKSGESSLDKPIVTAYWSDTEENILFYALGEHRWDEEIEWYQFDLSNGFEELVERENLYWFPSSGIFFDFYWQHRSPTGKYSIELEITKKDELISYFNIWLIHNDNYKKDLLYEGAVGNISQIEWSKDESVMALSWGYEGPEEIAIVDTEKGVATLLHEISNQIGYTDNAWTLSPDGSTIAVAGQSNLSLIFLNEEKIVNICNKLSTIPTWSQDSQVLYFYENDSHLKSYNIVDGSVSTLVTLHQLEKYEIPFYSLGYAVSPEENRVIIWHVSDIWLISLK